MKRGPSAIFFVLGFYVILQFSWWGYHLIDLTQKLDTDQLYISKRVTMIVGEGLVFFVLLLLGFWQVQKAVRKELKLADRQKNFLLSVTHELKTPLAANKLFWQTLQKHELSQDKQKEIIQKALQENDRLEQLIENILNASRIDGKDFMLNRERFNVSQTLHQLANRFEKRGISVSLVREIEDDCFINSDVSMVETVFTNLIENALKYGGNTTVTIYLKKMGERVMFGVRDLGPGVDQKDRSEIFKKFYRSGNEDTRTQKGTGLGLYISAEFVRMLGGKIAYKANQPEGAVFEVLI
ncbi:MAG: HAMP domain-containing sensor histidine kinase [Bacteroidota bacterium]